MENLKKIISILFIILLFCGCDYDKDGYTISQGDCNNNDPTIYPGAFEICGDSIDQNCDGKDLSCDDFDNDNDGYTENEGDCDDNNPEINPAIEEICCDGIDQNCDGKGCKIDLEDLFKVSQIKKLPCSGTYIKGSNSNKVLFITKFGVYHDYNYDNLNYYKPEEQEEVSLIAIIDDSWEVIETCSYKPVYQKPRNFTSGYEMNRKQQKLLISLYIASTGKFLESKVFWGDYPPPCPKQTFDKRISLYGSEVSFSKIFKWLAETI